MLWMSIKQSRKMEFNDIVNVDATHRAHCDCNPLYRHVHKCAYASATSTMSAWYKTCITFSIKTNWKASRGRRRGSRWCRVLSLSDYYRSEKANRKPHHSLNPLSQTRIDWVGRYRIRLTFKLSYAWRVRVVIIGVLLRIKYLLTNN